MLFDGGCGTLGAHRYVQQLPSYLLAGNGSAEGVEERDKSG